jgi:hypothetical protein
MKTTDVVEVIDAVISQNLALVGKQGIRLNLYLEGPPGGGKSSLVHQAVKRHGMEMIDLRLADRDPVDLRGVPVVVDMQTLWAASGELPRDPDWKGVVFIDELPQGTPMVQNAISQLVLDRRIGDYLLPDGAVIIAAGNPKSSKAASHDIPRHLANRFVFVQVETCLKGWGIWAAQNNIRPEITSFFHTHDNLLHAFDPTQKVNPTPRSWAYASEIMNLNLSPTNRMRLMAGAVGEGTAVVFEGHLRLWELVPDLSVILADPENAPVPEGREAPGITYALASKMAREMDKKNAPAMVKYLRRLSPEYAVVCMREATARSEELGAVKEVEKWLAEHYTLMVN